MVLHGWNYVFLLLEKRDFIEWESHDIVFHLFAALSQIVSSFEVVAKL